MATSSRTVLGTCHHDCPDSCGWEVTVADGRAVRLRGNPAHPFSRGELCPKVNRFLDRVYSPERLLTPLVLDGAKGSGQYRRASWDEALARGVERLQHPPGPRAGRTASCIPSMRRHVGSPTAI
jgi:anaerobic selenocysteine-containing dehydrogenase